MRMLRVRSTTCTRPTTYLLLLLALVVPLGGFAFQSARQLPIQPDLLAAAAQHPDAPISVIVQKLAKDAPVEATIARLGGTVTHNLHIINAVAAEVPPTALRELGATPGVRWVSLNAPVHETGGCSACISTSALKMVYPRVIGADQAWNNRPYLQGQGIGVAIVDSGIAGHMDFGSRMVTSVKFNSNTSNMSDSYGHGTHVAGIVGGNGSGSRGGYIGVAPNVNLINVKVSDDQGMASAADVVNGLQWILENKNAYNIRVVNLSLNSSILQSYHVDPLAAAAEILWFNKIVVVVAAGNTGTGGIYPPANDPFVITVGAMDDKGTLITGDDTLATFSAYGTTVDGFAKPDLVAPGKNIVSPMAGLGTVLPKSYPQHVVDGKANYFRMSGTSMATPMVAGAAALLLQDEPGLTPDQVKYRLMGTAQPLGIPGTGKGYLNVWGAINSASTNSANGGLKESQLLTADGSQQIWGSANWGSANWGSANWGSANWGSANWGSDYWGN